MEISQNGVDFLKEREGFRAEAYRDTGGVWTIGYGTIRIDGRPVVEGDRCTVEQAEKWIYTDTKSAQECITWAMGAVPLRTQNQFDALVSFVYNVGNNAFKTSTMLKKLRVMDYFGAAKEFDRWVYDNGKVVRGLIARRRLERSFFEEA